MAELNQQGNILARCPGCNGASSSFVYQLGSNELGVVRQFEKRHGGRGAADYELETQYRLFRCNACGMGAVAVILMAKSRGHYPDHIGRLHWFYPEAGERLPLPDSAPKGIVEEFREAERCLEAGCYRAAAALFRSALDKTMRANGYKTRKESKLIEQIAAACSEGVITKARQRRADDDVRVLGNDVLHEPWREMDLSDVEPAHRYTQRVIEDLYDDREVVLKQLNAAGRKPDDAQAEADSGAD